jgi:HEAT repeat protein
MKIPSVRTRRDMEVAAELRAQGATWETIGLKLQRQPGLLRRWTKVYSEEWERLLKEAEERLSRLAGNESRAVLRELLRSKKSTVRLAAAERLARLRMQEKAKEQPPEAHADVAAFIAAAEDMSDEELEEFLVELGNEVRGGQGE